MHHRVHHVAMLHTYNSKRTRGTGLAIKTNPSVALAKQALNSAIKRSPDMAPMVTSLFKEMSPMLSDFALGAVKKRQPSLTRICINNIRRQYTSLSKSDDACPFYAASPQSKVRYVCPSLGATQSTAVNPTVTGPSIKTYTYQELLMTLKI